MSPWTFGRRETRPTETTWMVEDLVLGPEWVQQEVNLSTLELKNWLSSHIPTENKAGTSPRSGGVRRGRRPKG